MKAEEILSSEEFKKCIEFHGHICPGLAIGFKAAQVLMARLDVRRIQDEELVTIVETDACGVDAIQVMTGCTFGKGNLVFKNYGKHAFSLADRRKGKVFRACLRSDAIVWDSTYFVLLRKVGEGEAKTEEVEELHRLRERRLREILEADYDFLFTIKELEIDLPPRASIVPSEICEKCGELTKVDLLEEIEGKKVCLPCKEDLLKKGRK